MLRREDREREVGGGRVVRAQCRPGGRAHGHDQPDRVPADAGGGRRLRRQLGRLPLFHGPDGGQSGERGDVQGQVPHFLALGHDRNSAQNSLDRVF